MVTHEQREARRATLLSGFRLQRRCVSWKPGIWGVCSSSLGRGTSQSGQRTINSGSWMRLPVRANGPGSVTGSTRRSWVMPERACQRWLMVRPAQPCPLRQTRWGQVSTANNYETRWDLTPQTE